MNQPNPVRVIRAGSDEARLAADAGCYVYVGRPSKWGNRFRIGPRRTREAAIALFQEWWEAPEQEVLRAAALEEIPPGILLGCYCAPRPCHGDVIADFLNRARA